MISIKKALLIFLIAMPNFVIANPMKGIKEVGIVIEKLDDDAKRCNITEGYLDAAIRVRLSSSSLKVVSMDRMPPAFIYVAITVLDDKDFCIGSVSTSFNKYINSERAIGNFWELTELLNIRRINFQNRVGDVVDRNATQFLGAWLKANQN